MNGLRRFLRDWAIIEVALLLLVVASYVAGWCHQKEGALGSEGTRQLIATTIVYVLNGTLAVASIILSGALIGLQAVQHLPAEGKTHILYAVRWAVVSIIAGAWDLAMLPSRVEQHNLSYDPMVAIFGAVLLFSMIFAAVRLMFAVQIALR